MTGVQTCALPISRGAGGDLSRWPHGLSLLLLLQLLPPATLGQDRLDAPPPPAAPLSRWSGPVGVSWGLRAAAPGGPAPRGGRWRRSALDEDEDCGGVRDFVGRLANNTHQVSGRRARAPPGLRGATRGPLAAGPRTRLLFLCPRASRPSGGDPGRSPASRRPRHLGRGPETAAGGRAESGRESGPPIFFKMDGKLKPSRRSRSKRERIRRREAVGRVGVALSVALNHCHPPSSRCPFH